MWTVPPARIHAQVSRTESANGRVRRPAAFADAPETAQNPAVPGIAGIHSGSSAHGCTPWEGRKPSSIHTGVATAPVACTQLSTSPAMVVFGPSGTALWMPHAVRALGQPGTRIVAAHRPGVALAVFAEAHDEG